jgi:hypothetical protein
MAFACPVSVGPDAQDLHEHHAGNNPDRKQTDKADDKGARSITGIRIRTVYRCGLTVHGNLQLLMTLFASCYGRQDG